MSILEGFKIALQSLWANKLRSILTLLGVVIGIASVITVVTLTNGAKQFVTSKINSYGAAIITVSKMPQTFMTLQEYLTYQKRKDITYDDYRAILDELLASGVAERVNGKGIRLKSRGRLMPRGSHEALQKAGDGIDGLLAQIEKHLHSDRDRARI